MGDVVPSVENIAGLLMEPDRSGRGRRIFLVGTLGGVRIRILIDLGAEINVVSSHWVQDNIESVKSWMVKCAKFWVRGVTPGAKMENDTELRGIPVKLPAQGNLNFEDEMSLKILEMEQNDEYDAIFGIPWLEQYTGFTGKFRITTEKRGLCLSATEVTESDMPSLPQYVEGEEFQAGVFSMSAIANSAFQKISRLTAGIP